MCIGCFFGEFPELLVGLGFAFEDASRRVKRLPGLSFSETNECFPAASPAAVQA